MLISKALAGHQMNKLRPMLLDAYAFRIFKSEIISIISLYSNHYTFSFGRSINNLFNAI